MLKKKKIGISILILAPLLFIGIFFSTQNTFLREDSPDFTSKTYETNAILEINGEKYKSEITNQLSVYDFMDKLQSEGKINFKEKNYTGIGKFIEEINGLKSDEGRYWIYYVNSAKADIGVSDYKINPGDVVSWKYEKDY